MRSLRYSCCRFNALCIWICYCCCCCFCPADMLIIVVVFDVVFVFFFFCTIQIFDMLCRAYLRLQYTCTYARVLSMFVFAVTAAAAATVRTVYAARMNERTNERKKENTTGTYKSDAVELFHINWPNALKFRLVCSRLSLIADLFHWSFFSKKFKTFSFLKYMIVWICAIFYLCLWKKNEKSRANQNRNLSVCLIVFRSWK